MRKAAVLACALVLAAPIVSGDQIQTISLAQILAELARDAASGPANTPLRQSVLHYSSERTHELDRGDTAAIGSAVLDIEASTRANLTTALNTLSSAATISELVHAVYDTTNGPGNWQGNRTNLATARGPGGLAEGMIALHHEAGRPLTVTEELTVRQQTALLPTEVSKAGAILVYATIDAMNYREAAAAGVDANAIKVIEENLTALSMLHRRMRIDESGGAPVQVFDANTTRTLEAVVNLSNSVSPTALTALYQSLDVIGQAIDEVRGLALPGAVQEQPDEQNQCVAPGDRVVQSTPGCLVVIGGYSDATYRAIDEGGKGNIILLDLGGNDRYIHRAGGGYAAVQVNVDLGNGNDIYSASATQTSGNRSVWGPHQGAGSNRGVGVLYDDGGNDLYRAFTRAHVGVIAQGGATLVGAGMLLDRAGDDRYEIVQDGDGIPAHGQAAALSQGVAILRDSGGADRYTFSVIPLSTTNPPVPADGGGAQGFAAGSAAAYLLDYGLGNDNYVAGQDEVHGAATAMSFALFHDDGGDNNLTVMSTRGCPTIFDRRCDQLPTGEYVPLAGWSQGYALANGTAVLALGSGRDDLTYARSGTETTPHEGLDLMASSSVGGLAILYNAGGDDIYDAAGSSLGVGKSGMGIFLDTGGWDTYRCAAVTCIGDGTSLGLGVFYDGISSGDTFEDSNSRVLPWARGELGIGARVTP